MLETMADFTARKKRSRYDWGFAISANIGPIVGLAFFDWSVFSLMLLYWFETVVIGLFNVPAMVMARGSEVDLSVFDRLFFAGFFCVHFGAFCAGLGLFVWGFFLDQIPTSPFADLGTPIAAEGIAICVAAMIAGYAIRFVDAARRGDVHRQDPTHLLFSPYGRIVVLSLTIAVGAGLSLMIHTRAIIFFFIIAKFFADLAPQKPLAFVAKKDAAQAKSAAPKESAAV